MPSFILMLPFALLGFLAYQFVDPDTQPVLFATLCVLAVGGIIGLYVLRAAIDEWWFNRSGGRRLSKDENEFLNRLMPYYRELNPDLKALFQRRLFNFRLQKSYEVPGHEGLPADVQLLVCATAIQVTLGLEKYIYPNLGMLVFYQKMFVTPQVPTRPHAMEFNREEDNSSAATRPKEGRFSKGQPKVRKGVDFDCIVLSMDAFVSGFTKPHEFYQVALHSFAQAHQADNGPGDDELPLFGLPSKEALAEKLCDVRGFFRGYQHTVTGKNELELFPMCVENFFQKPFEFKEQLPDLYNFMKNYLHQDPCFPDSPIIQVPPELEYMPPLPDTDEVALLPASPSE